MGAPYSTTTVSGYSASPPSDDGTQTAANQVTYSTLKTKLGDPLNTAVAAIDTKLVASFDYAVRSVSANYTTVAADHMKTVEVASNVSSAVTISLGDALTMGTSYRLWVRNSGSSTVTVGRITAGDTINGCLLYTSPSPRDS